MSHHSASTNFLIILLPTPTPTLPMGSVQFSSVAQLCPTLCNPMNRSTPGLPVHHQLNGQESEQTPGDSGGQRNLMCCSPCRRNESDTS